MTSEGGTLSRRAVLGGAGVLAASALGAGASQAYPRAGGLPAIAGVSAPDNRPNVVLIMADDIGYSDLGCYGSEIATPNLDRLGFEGLRLAGMTTNPRCCPSRASLLTGLYPTQTGVGYMSRNQGTAAYQGFLNDECRTLAEVLGAAGYQTAMSGKWHVGPWGTGVIPATRGFDRSFGPLRGAGSYFSPMLYRDDRVVGRPVDPDFYLTDAIAADAARSIRQMATSDEPFLSYVAFTAPHWPLQARATEVDPYRGRYRDGWERVRQDRFARQQELGVVDGVEELPPLGRRVHRWRDAPDKRWEDARMATYAAQVTAMDRGVGEIMDALLGAGVRDNTIVLFLGDNGGAAEHVPDPPGGFGSYGLGWAHASNTPFTKYKHWTRQGGIATPAILSWPGHVAPAQVDTRPLHLIDVMPTLAEVAAAPYPLGMAGSWIHPVEGISFAPLLERPAAAVPRTEERELFWEHQGNRAVRRGRWKLLSDRPGQWELYDLEADRAEQHDLVRRHPAKAGELARAYREWAQRTGVLPYRPGSGYRPRV